MSVGAAGCAPNAATGRADSGFAARPARRRDPLRDDRTDGAADEDDAVDVYERNLSRRVDDAGLRGRRGMRAGLRKRQPDGDAARRLGRRSRAFFATVESLSSADGDTAIDIYARDLPAGPTELVTRRGLGLRADLRQRRRRRGLRRQLGRRRGCLLRNERRSRSRGHGRSQRRLSAGRRRDDDGLGGTETTPANVAQDNGSGRPAVSDDGTKVLFTTAEGLAAGDKNDAGGRVRVVGAASPVLVTSGTCDPSGEAVGRPSTPPRATRRSCSSRPTEGLDPADTDSSVDIYESDHRGRRFGARLERGPGCAPGCGNGAVSAIFNATSGDASKVFFTSSEQLAPQDEDAEPTSTSDLLALGDDAGQPGRGLPVGTGCNVIFTGASSEGVHVVLPDRRTAEPG